MKIVLAVKNYMDKCNKVNKSCEKENPNIFR